MSSNDETSSAKANLRILLVDDSTEDRMQLETLLAAAGAVHAAASPAEASKIADSLESVDVVVASIPSEDGDAVFAMRDGLVKKFGEVPMAFCSREDMSKFYDRVHSGEMLFYKPVDDEVLRKWLAEATGVSAEDLLPPVAEMTEPVTPGTPEALPDELLEVGTILGDYKLLRLIQHDENFAMYEAEQMSISRRVALKILFRKHRRDPHWVGGFAEEARARALVTHPEISLVYEADQERGVTFYTLELIEGRSLHEMASKGSSLNEKSILRILKSCGDAICYLNANQMVFRPFSAETIFLVNDDHPRIANPVKSGASGPPADETEQMSRIAAAVRPFLKPPGRGDRRLASLVDRLADPSRVDGIRTARGLLEAVGRLEDAAYDEPENAEAEAVEDGNRKAVMIGAAIGGLIILVLLIWYFASGGARPPVKDFSRMIRIPDGPFIYQENERIELAEFWIDEHEVTIAQYAEFLADLEANPEKLAELRHEREPETKTSYKPAEWDEYYDAAIRGKTFRGAPIDPNCPVMQVDWFDAQAYAKWKGNRLPTEREWEKAGRGRSGSIYPWGDEIAMEKFNSGADRDEANAGSIDGYRYWAPVDAHLGDVSRYGVKGLAGNVSEWTATEDNHPDQTDRKVPIKRGASFNTTEGYELTGRRPAENPEEAGFPTGFRTARSSPPPVEAGAEPEPESEGENENDPPGPDDDADDGSSEPAETPATEAPSTNPEPATATPES